VQTAHLCWTLFLDVAQYVESPQSSSATPPVAGEQADQALLRACRSVMAPLARLAVARGTRYAQLDELLRSAFVEAAREAHSDVPAHRAVSRVSAATGLNRREVTRLIKADEPEVPKRSPATEVFTRWLSDPKLRRKGAPLRSLPRHGAAPSFESLAQSVTKDVHPRALLEDLCRLGLVKIDEATDAIVLLRDKFVPTGDEHRLFGFLGANVGDHLSAGVANVLNPMPRHLEQALFADELSGESVERLRPIVSEQWQALVRTLVPTVQQLIDEDAASGRAQDHRLRVGLYAFADRMSGIFDGPAEPGAAAPPSAANRRRKE